MEIKLILRDQSVIKFKESQNKLATDFVNQIKFIFQIEGDWQDKELVAQFSQKVCSADEQAPEQIEKSMPIENGSVLLPKEFAQYPGILFVSVFGKVTGEVTMFTSIPTEYQIVPSGFISNAEEPIPPTPNLYDELLSSLRQTETNVNQKAKEVAQSADKVEEAQQTAQEAKNIADTIQANAEAGLYNGKDGTNGLDGKDGVNGIDGKDGKDGVNGTDGKSAYEIAVDNGYSGTEAEWLDSLKGKSAEILDNSITTSKLADKSVTLDKIADGIIPDIENIKMLFFINNENDLNNALSKLFDDEGNVTLSQGESAILIISQNLDEIGYERGIMCIDSEANANYVTTTVDDLKKYLTKSDIKPMFDNLKYKLIYDVTITQEVTKVLKGGLNLKEAFVVVYGKGSKNNDGKSPTTIFSVASNIQGLTHCSKLTAQYSVFSVNDNVNYLEAKVLGNKIKTIASNRYSPTEIRRVLNGCENIIDGDYIQSIMVGSSVPDAVLGIGTKIEIWGIEANEG